MSKSGIFLADKVKDLLRFTDKLIELYFVNQCHYIKGFLHLSSTANKFRLFSLLTVLVAVFSLAGSCLFYGESFGSASSRINLSKNLDITFKNSINKHADCLTESCVKYCISDNGGLLRSEVLALANNTDIEIPDFPRSYSYSGGYTTISYRPINTYLYPPSNSIFFKRNPVLRV